MGIEGAACRQGTIKTGLVPCGEVVPEQAVQPVGMVHANTPKILKRLL
jgi:hypothetical protein